MKIKKAFIPGYGDRYIVYSDGRIYSNFINNFMKFGVTKWGYYMVTLCGKGPHKTTTVHRIIAKLFIPKKRGKKQVNHIDGDKKNNNVSNLEWTDHSGNMQHAIRIGLKKYRYDDGHWNTILGLKQQREIKHKYTTEGLTQYQLADMYGVTQGQISRIVNDAKKRKHFNKK